MEMIHQSGKIPLNDSTGMCRRVGSENIRLRIGNGVEFNKILQEYGKDSKCVKNSLS